MFCSSERLAAPQLAGRAAGGEGGAAALGSGAGGRADLPQTTSPAAAQLPGAGEAEEQRGAGEPARPAAAAGLDQEHHVSSHFFISF